MAQPGARLGYVPHFDVVTLNGQRVHYRDLWQRRNVVLLLVSPGDRGVAERFAAQVDAHRSEFEESDADVVVTTGPVPGFSPPRLVVADRWGEILHMEAPEHASGHERLTHAGAVPWGSFRPNRRHAPPRGRPHARSRQGIQLAACSR